MQNSIICRTFALVIATLYTMTTTLIIGLLIPLLGTMLGSVLPYMLAFAAGAMLYVVVEELIPEASNGQHSNLSTIGFAVGFVLMMVLDVVMG